MCTYAFASLVSNSLQERSSCNLKGFSTQEYWSGLPCSSPGDLPNPGMEHMSLALQADSLPTESLGNPWEGRVRNNFRKICPCIDLLTWPT